MSWHAEHMLWLLLLMPLAAALLLLSWRSRQRARLRFGRADTTERMVLGRSGKWRAARGVIFVLGIGLLVIALARPQYGSRTRMLRKRGVDVVVALDFSKSMLAKDVHPSRIERAKAELTRFVDELAGDRIGMVAFAGETMQFPLTIDYSAAALFFRELGPYDMPVGGTAIGRALTASKRLLERASRDKPDAAEQEAMERAKVVILMTDGEDHVGDPLAAAEELASIDARIYVVGIGTRTGEPIPTFADDGTWTGYMRDDDGESVITALTADNEKQLKEIARLSGGAYFRAGRGSVGMDQIRSAMRKMKQTELRARKITVHEQRYAAVLFLAFILLVLEALLPEAWVRRSSGGAS